MYLNKNCRVKFFEIEPDWKLPEVKQEIWEEFYCFDVTLEDYLTVGTDEVITQLITEV